MSRITRISIDGNEHIVKHNGDLLYAIVVELGGFAAREIDRKHIAVQLPDRIVTVTIKSDRRSPKK